MVICLEQGADLHMAQLMPLLLTVSCFSKIQIGFAFLVPAHPGSPGQRAVKRVCVCVCSMPILHICIYYYNSKSNAGDKTLIKNTISQWKNFVAQNIMLCHNLFLSSYYKDS